MLYTRITIWLTAISTAAAIYYLSSNTPLVVVVVAEQAKEQAGSYSQLSSVVLLPLYRTDETELVLGDSA